MKNSVMRRTSGWALACGLAVVLAACGGGGGGGGGDSPPVAATASLFAGSLRSEGSRDGTRATAQFNHPGGVAQDAAGNVYVADTGNNTIRKITDAGVVTTIAGPAGFSSPQGLALDAAGNLYVADTGNNAVRRISAAGVVTTVASVDAPIRVAVDGTGTLYALSNKAVRKVAPDGSVTTFPVQLEFSSHRFYGIAVDAAGNVFLAEGPTGSVEVSPGGGAIRKFGSMGQPLPLGTATDGVLRFTLPADIAADANGNLYVSKVGVFLPSGYVVLYYRNVQRIAPDGSIALLAGPAEEWSRSAMTLDGPANVARFADPRAISVGPGGRVVVAETATSAVRAIDAQGNVSTLAGGDGSGYRDGAGAEARLSAPQGVATTADGSLYVVDSRNLSLRQVSTAGVVTTVRAPETLGSPANVAVAPNGTFYLTEYLGIFGFICSNTAYFVIADGTLNGFSVSYNGSESARAVTVDAAGNVVVNERADPDPARTRNCGVDSGQPTRISALAADGSRRVLASGIEATALAADASGLVYFATAQGTVGSVNTIGEVTTWAGAAGQPGDADGAGADARFRSPTALAVSATGNLYVADGTRIRQVSPTGTVSTSADLAALEGVAATSPIRGLAWSAGALYATVRNAVVRIAPAN